MIRLTRLNHVPFMLNAELIEHIEFTPDTVISLTSGQTIVVLESPEDVVDRVIEFRRAICSTPLDGPRRSNDPENRPNSQEESHGG